ncbi:CHAT domain-containing tetratricopeptide repeat protein [Streptomyces apricus]|uniref:CHAT domain-containing protein n=1 Tax=Streptomyces apricus TaxID=1828112 RepID=A0A5B0BHR7_9ACTN|nr:CHAT domain-containing tetratricopeptide repeat protein [Streptomyces apricus]KAA0940812.1 CHAT domain-containing protein [Streptomyces apricus]
MADDGNDEGVLDVIRQLIPFLVAVHDWKGTADTSRLGLDAAVRLDSMADRVDLSQSLGAALQRMERDTEAKEAFRRAEELATESGDRRARAAALAHLGQLRHHHGDLPEATELLQQAVLAYRSAGHIAGEARTLGDLAPLLHQLGAPVEAESYARRARTLFHDIGDHVQEARALRLIAAAEAERHANEDALRSLDDAVRLFDAVGAVHEAVEALHTAALLHRREGKTSGARAAAERALDRARASGDATVREIEQLHAVVEAEEALSALLAARTEEDRTAAVSRYPALLGGLALQMLIRQRDTVDVLIGDRAAVGHENTVGHESEVGPGDTGDAENSEAARHGLLSEGGSEDVQAMASALRDLVEERDLVNESEGTGSSEAMDAVRDHLAKADERAGVMDAALDHLARRPDGALADWRRIDWAETSRVAGDTADRLPAELPDLLLRLLTTDRPERREPLLQRLLDVVPADRFPAVHGLHLAELARLYAADTGEPDHERAIRLAEDALRLLDRPEARDKWAATQTFLGSVWRARRLGDKGDNIDRAQGAFRAALTHYRRRTAPVEWAATMVNLANAYWEYPHDRVRNLRRALARHTAALTVFTRSDHPDRWAAVQNNVGLVLSDPALAADPDSLELGRRQLEQALNMRELGPRQRVAALTNLSRCYRMRVRGDHDGNHSTALRHARAAFDLSEQLGQRHDMANAATAVADALANAAVRDEEGRTSLDEAVTWYRRALDLAPADEDPLMHAAIADNLAGTLVQRAEPSPEDFRTAIALHESALRAYETHGNPLEAARARYNLAATLRRGDRPDPGRAIALLEHSLDVRTPDVVPLEWAESATELARAWMTWQDAPGGPERFRDAAGILRKVVPVVTAAGASGHARRAWGLLGDAEAERGNWVSAADAYEQALAAAERLYQVAILPGGKEAELTETADLPREAAHALARAGRPERAAAVLEQHRARALGDRLQRDRAELAALSVDHEAAVTAYQDAVRRIRTVEARQREPRTTAASPEDQRRLRAAMTDAQAQLNAAVEAIRGLPSYGDFMRATPEPAVDEATASGLPLIYLATTRHGSVCLVVRRPPGRSETVVEAVPCPLSEPEVLTCLALHPSLEEDEDLTVLLDLLGARLVGPLAARLRALDVTRTVLVPTGILGVLPVHASRYLVDGRPRHLFDDVAVSHVPSARVLAAARAGTTEPGPTESLRLLGVAEPHPCDPPLPWAGPELAAVRQLFATPGDCLTGRAATKDALLRALSTATHLHFAGHGYYDPEEPLASHLALADGEHLTLRDLLDGQALRGVRLVVASACQTAVTDMARLPDESVGLPAGLVQAGATAVIGSLWEVNDRSTALLVARIYDYHLHGDPERGEPPTPPSVALARAQAWMRDATSQELDAFAARVGLRRRTHARYAERPSHWAPFVLVGDG